MNLIYFTQDAYKAIKKDIQKNADKYVVVLSGDANMNEKREYTVDGAETEYTFNVPNSAEFHINGEVIPLGKGEHKFTF